MLVPNPRRGVFYTPEKYKYLQRYEVYDPSVTEFKELAESLGIVNDIRAIKVPAGTPFSGCHTYRRNCFVYVYKGVVFVQSYATIACAWVLNGSMFGGRCPFVKLSTMSCISTTNHLYRAYEWIQVWTSLRLPGKVDVFRIVAPWESKYKPVANLEQLVGLAAKAPEFGFEILSPEIQTILKVSHGF